MKKTSFFIENMLSKGFVNEVEFLSNGYDIKVGKDTVSVRTKGSRAVIWNHKDARLTEVVSGRLDDILHRYIVLSCVGKTSAKTKLGEYKNVVFVPQAIVNGKLVLKDSLNRAWVVNSYTGENALNMFNEMNNVSADDCMLLMNGLTPYTKNTKITIESSYKDVEAELLSLQSSIDVDGYAVYPKSDAINKVGTTLVGSFLASATDRANVELFENLELELSSKKTLHATNSSIADFKTTGVAEEVRKTIVSSGKAKAFDEYCDKTYGNGITVDGLNSALAYDTGKIYSALGIKTAVTHFKPIVQSMLEESDSAYLCLTSNKEVKVCAQKVNTFSAMFTAVPNVEVIKNALARDGYTLKDLQSGMTVALDSEVLEAIMNSSMDFTPVAEKAYLANMTAKSLIGSAVTGELAKVGIEDKTRAFSNMIVLTVD